MPKKLTREPPEGELAAIAARQHGTVTTQQLLDAGLHPSGISDRIRASRLHRVHRGVYAVGHAALGNEGRWMAAVLACGRGAVLSHSSAARLWRLLPDGSARFGDKQGAIDVTVSGQGKSRRGIRVHRSATLSSADCTRRAGIPVTKPARTLEDLRRVLPDKVFGAALRQAEFQGLALGDLMRPDHTRSELETRFLALLGRHRLPQPEVNVRVDRFVVDFLWRAERLVVELDGWGTHGTRSAFEADRARDARLKLVGYDVLRLTWR